MNKMKRIISGLKSEKNGYRRIKHKQGWFDYLEDGDMGFTPQGLKKTIVRVVEKNPPRGEKLFDLDWCHQGKRSNFTMLPPKNPKFGVPVQPYRTEEALERFIVLSNDIRFYNQIPIGGGRESIDIGIKESDSKFIFVELKLWESNDSPLYALIESLKNLVEYWTIPKEKIPENKKYEHIELMVLAPLAYYHAYGLIYKGQERYDRGIGRMQELLNELSNAFDTKITLMFLQLEEQKFLECCKSVFDKRKPTRPDGKTVIWLRKSDTIPELKRELWKPIIASD